MVGAGSHTYPLLVDVDTSCVPPAPLPIRGVGQVQWATGLWKGLLEMEVRSIEQDPFICLL